MSQQPVEELSRIGMPTTGQVDRAMRITYLQVMLGAVFGASTGGMFLIGFALALGANDIIMGLLTAIPQLFVVFQLGSSVLVERGISRKKLTLIFSFIQPLCWLLIAAIPVFERHLDVTMKFAILIGVLSLATIAAQIAGNARGSWVGELIPEDRRGKFFGRCTMWGGIVGAAFAIGEGRFIDIVRQHGLFMFASLFFFGTLFGLATAALHAPQPDCPLPGDAEKPGFISLVRETFKNRMLVRLALAHAVLAMSGIAGPFFATYMLRDVGVSFFGLGLLNSIGTIAALVSAPFWGRCVDRFGSRPILLLGLLIWGPLSLIWLGISPGQPESAYWLLPWTNALAGLGGGAVGISITTMIYKIATPRGRSVQFAIYGCFVTMVGAPMPIFGGWLVTALSKTAFVPDLRLTFYISALLIFLAALAARRIEEPKSVSVKACITQLSESAPAPIRALVAMLLKPIEFWQ